MCFGGRDNEDAAGAARSHELDKLIRADEKRKSKEVKLLLLGTRKPPFLPHHHSFHSLPTRAQPHNLCSTTACPATLQNANC